jgi:hypothetical protein
LCDEGDGFAVFFLVDIGDVGAVTEFFSFLGFIESFEEGNYTGFAAPGRTD